MVHAHQVPRKHLDWPVSILCSLDLVQKQLVQIAKGVAGQTVLWRAAAMKMTATGSRPCSVDCSKRGLPKRNDNSDLSHGLSIWSSAITMVLSRANSLITVLSGKLKSRVVLAVFNMPPSSTCTLKTAAGASATFGRVHSQKHWNSVESSCLG